MDVKVLEFKLKGFLMIHVLLSFSVPLKKGSCSIFKYGDSYNRLFDRRGAEHRGLRPAFRINLSKLSK